MDSILLLNYGIMSPYCATALGVSIIAQIYLVKIRLIRYYRLQLSELSGESFDKLEQNHQHIDLICENAQSNISSMLWPGVTLTGFIMGLILFDMAYDTDDSNTSIAVPLTLLLLTVVSIISMMFVFYRATRKAREDLQSRLSSLVASEIVLSPISSIMVSADKEIE